MAGKLVALILMAVVAVNAKTLDGAKTHTSKPKKDKTPAAPAAAAPSGSAAGGSPPATAAKSTKKSSPYTFTASMSEDQKKVFKETLKKMSEARKISDAEQRKAQSQALDKSLHTLLGNDVYKTYRAESAARHKENAAKHQQQQGTAPGTPSAPQASAPSQGPPGAAAAAPAAAPKEHKEHKKKSSSSSQAPAAAGDGAASNPPKAKKSKTSKKPSSSTPAA